jgi:hypothetical protein
LLAVICLRRSLIITLPYHPLIAIAVITCGQRSTNQRAAFNIWYLGTPSVVKTCVPRPGIGWLAYSSDVMSSDNKGFRGVSEGTQYWTKRDCFPLDSRIHNNVPFACRPNSRSNKRRINSQRIPGRKSVRFSFGWWCLSNKRHFWEASSRRRIKRPGQ